MYMYLYNVAIKNKCIYMHVRMYMCNVHIFVLQVVNHKVVRYSYLFYIDRERERLKKRQLEKGTTNTNNVKCKW